MQAASVVCISSLHTTKSPHMRSARHLAAASAATTTTTTVPLLLLLLIIVPSTAPSSDEYPIALPGCQHRCGGISIPYPFGIGLNCSLNSWFNVSCANSTPSLLRLSWESGGLISPVQILDINLGVNESPSLAISGSYQHHSANISQADTDPLTSLNMMGSPFVLSGTRNVLVVQGCGGSVLVKDAGNNTVAGCSSICSNISLDISGYMSCYGIQCCQTSIANYLNYFRVEYFTPFLSGSGSQSMVKVAVFDTGYMASKSVADSFSKQSSIPTILQWFAPDLPDSPDYPNSICTPALLSNQTGNTCRCKSEIYIGNPYLPNGCQVVKECRNCPNACITIPTINNATTHTCRRPVLGPKNTSMPIALGLGISLGTLLLSILLYGLYRFLKQRKDIRQKQNNFKRNGGLILQQQMSATDGVVEKIKLYTSNELEKATDNFNANRIVGRGGQGTVYKGMLDDGTISAIKKSEKVSGSRQLKQFINEVVILSQVNHRNVVKLFGCCLETEVPLLVYEYVINGTLSENICNPTEEFRLTWKMRLQIAIQSAEALAYLHSSSSTPIYHKDVKTSNILLDDKYRAKVSDFGISKSIEIDQTHVTNTHVEGTFGYIDPEFYRSRQYTDKSDVYSFGVILVELITSKKAVYEDNSCAINLASTFLDLKQSSRLYDIVDAKVLEEARREEIEGVADLAEQCLLMTGRQRPTMKEVVTTLLMITSQPRVLISSSDHVFDGKVDLASEFPSTNSVMYASSEDPKQPLFSTTSTFSSSTDFGM